MKKWQENAKLNAALYGKNSHGLHKEKRQTGSSWEIAIPEFPSLELQTEVDRGGGLSRFLYDMAL